MLWADVTFSDAGIAVITVLVGALCAAIALLFRLLIASLTSQTSDALASRDRWREIALEAIDALESVGNRVRIALPPGDSAARLGRVVVTDGPPVTRSDQMTEYKLARERLNRAKGTPGESQMPAGEPPPAG